MGGKEEARRQMRKCLEKAQVQGRANRAVWVWVWKRACEFAVCVKGREMCAGGGSAFGQVA
jgi:hypothetical protein